jgi:hypothetical protein
MESLRGAFPTGWLNPSLREDASSIRVTSKGQSHRQDGQPTPQQPHAGRRMDMPESRCVRGLRVSEANVVSPSLPGLFDIEASPKRFHDKYSSTALHRWTSSSKGWSGEGHNKPINSFEGGSTHPIVSPRRPTPIHTQLVSGNASPERSLRGRTRLVAPRQRKHPRIILGITFCDPQGAW